MLNEKKISSTCNSTLLFKSYTGQVGLGAFQVPNISGKLFAFFYRLHQVDYMCFQFQLYWIHIALTIRNWKWIIDWNRKRTLWFHLTMQWFCCWYCCKKLQSFKKISCSFLPNSHYFDNELLMNLEIEKEISMRELTVVTCT